MDDDALRRLVEAVTARPGFTSAIGTRVLDVKKGQVALALDRRPDLVQAAGYFHGGVISALADHAAGGAVTTALPAGRFAMTVDLHVNFLAPGDGEALVARARAVHVGGSIGVAQVDVATVKDGDERPCAIATATLRAIELPAAR
jgi:uncharacterized protein (TIGR00369 family)